MAKILLPEPLVKHKRCRWLYKQPDKVSMLRVEYVVGFIGNDRRGNGVSVLCRSTLIEAAGLGCLLLTPVRGAQLLFRKPYLGPKPGDALHRNE